MDPILSLQAGKLDILHYYVYSVSNTPFRKSTRF